MKDGSQWSKSELENYFVKDILQNDKILHGRHLAKQRLFVMLQDRSALRKRGLRIVSIKAKEIVLLRMYV